jgi:hypothetical protein
MSTENTEAELDAAFNSGFDDDAPAATQPAAEAPAQSPEAAEAERAAEEADELAGLPPKVRELLAQMESLKQAASLVPTLEHRLRSAEGRVAALQKQVPAPTPPAPPRLEAFERVREELPEVAEAMEEYFQSRQAKVDTEQQAEPAAETPSVLAEEAPDWEKTVVSSDFQQWLKSQDQAYRTKVETTNSEAVMLAAITKFDAHRTLQAERQAAAQKAAQTRQARVAGAVVPTGAGRRAPTEMSLEEAFASGFSSQR